MEEFKQYRRKSILELRPYIKGEDITDISFTNAVDIEKDMGMIIRDPQNHSDQWYVPRKIFEEKFELVK